MDTSTSDNVKTVKDGDMPMYVPPEKVDDKPATTSTKQQGPGSGLDADTVRHLEAVTATAAGPNKLVATGSDGKLPSSIIPSSAVPNFVTSQAVSSNVIGTVYQNTGSKPLCVAVSVSCANAVMANAYSDSNASPTTNIARVGIETGGAIQATTADFQLFFIVMPGNYYKVTGGTKIVWTEWS